MRGEESPDSGSNPPAASRGILFMLGTLGLFYSFIATIDPYL